MVKKTKSATSKSRMLSGAEIVMEILLENDVDTVFGYPGGAALNIYDALYKYQNKIKHVLTSHEQGAGHAADGYARATGKIGVVFATSGPGATNLVTPIATAYMDSVPLVVITANVGSALIGKDAFQEISITEVTQSITKHNFFVNKIEDLAPALRSAFEITQSERPRPVLIDITKDVTANIAQYFPQPKQKKRDFIEPPDFMFPQFIEYLKKAKRPVVYLGGGINSDYSRKQVLEFLKKYQAPAVHSLLGSTILDSDSPQNLGMLGMHGSFQANKTVEESDLIIALGTRFADRVVSSPKDFAPQAKKIQIDIDYSEINKNLIVDCALVGDVGECLKKINTQLFDKSSNYSFTKWNKTIQTFQLPTSIKSTNKALNNKAKNSTPDFVDPEQLINSINQLTPSDTIFVTDVGQHQMWAAQYLKHKKFRSFITSGGLGTMGFGYGAAIGSAVGNPGKPVIHLTGDGSFNMNINEASTVAHNQFPIITVIFDNQVLGMVYQWQSLLYGRRYSQTKISKGTDYVEVAQGFGISGYSVDNLKDFKSVLKTALASQKPAWIQVKINPESKVLPMIPAGKAFKDIILEDF